MLVAVASLNPVKIKATTEGFEMMFPGANPAFLGVAAPSGVSDQPMTDAETLLGARNRADFVRNKVPDADFIVGIEGGIETRENAVFAFAWVIVLGPEGKGEARSAAFAIPLQVADYVRAGMELGAADDLVFKAQDSKRKNGAIGLLTRDAITREALYAQPVAMALIPFIWPEWYLTPAP